jgi:tyrosine-protein kinase Etk/Wzc
VDPKVRYPEQVTQKMRLNILGAIPRVGSRAMRSPDDMAPAVEALRALRLRVLHALSGMEPLMLTVTSPSVGEGKSFTSSNLALSFADAGYRTLLVDGDLRRGALHVVLGLPQAAGLTDVLAGRSTVAEAMRETSNPGLTLMGCGARMHRAPELLLSRKLKDAIEEVKSQFDVIIIDSPPLAAGVDPIILGTITRNLMVVLRSGTTDLPLVTAKLEVLDSLPIRVIGAVLNDVRDGGAFKNYTYESSEYIKALGGTAATGREAIRILHGANADD